MNCTKRVENFKYKSVTKYFRYQFHFLFKFRNFTSIGVIFLNLFEGDKKCINIQKTNRINGYNHLGLIIVS